MTRPDRRYLNLAAQIPCVVCWEHLGVRSPAELHHPRGAEFGTGLGLKASDRDVISLCPAHHRIGPDAYHVSPARFESRFGTQRELLNLTRRLVAELEELSVNA